MSSDLNIVFAPNLNQRSLSEAQRKGLIRIVKAQVILLITDLNNNNFIERLSEIDDLIQIYGQDVHEHLLYFLLSNTCEESQRNSPMVNLLNHYVHFSSEETETILSFCFALQKFCKQDKACQLNLGSLFSLLHLDSFDKVILSLSVFQDTSSKISEQAKSIFTANSQTALYDLPNRRITSKNVSSYILNCFLKALNDNIYEPNTEDLSLILALAEQHSLDQASIDMLQKIRLASTQKDRLNRLKQTFFMYREQQSIAHTDTTHLKELLTDTYNHDASSIKQILNTMQEQEVFPSILDVLPLHFAIEFALEANGQKIISFERFLQQRADIQGDTFVQDCLDYLSQKILAETASRQQGFNTTKPDVPAPLSNKELGIFLKVMSNSVTSPHQLEQIIQLQNQFLLLYPDFSTMIDGLKTPVSEEEANAYYERLYTGRLSVDEMVNLLKGLKKSEGTREQQLFECMINVLFDEYPFFSKYPEKELAITSTLFGQLIQQDVMHATQIDRALLYTLEAFRYPANIKMTDFGVQALSQFEYRLSEWPQFCLNVLQLPGFVDSQPRLANIIKASQKVKQRQPKVISHIPIACIKLPSLSKSTMLEMDEYVKLSNPDQATQDRISSIISYLAFDNIGNKIEELKKLLSPMHYQWFSKHLVNKYIPSKQDLHALYAAVLESISSKLLDTFILYETFSSILASLNSSTISFGPIDHTILNNLGSWLGRITLAKNKPILDKHMAFKELLLQGYDTQRLITIIPFACKILEQGSNGKVFIPPNPWLMAVLGLLAEMYHFASLTTDLKADIEKLCDSLSTKIKDINISSLLRSRMVKTNDPNPDGDIDSAYQNRTEVILSLNPSSFAFNIIINPQVPLDVTNATVREWIAQSFIQSISEACDSSIEYAARVSAITTRDIVLKDFVKEQDELKMRNAAHNMVQALAANLVLTSTNQFLEATVSKNLKRVLLALGLSNNVAEQSTILIIADNLSLLNSSIQTMAMDRATAKINNALASEFANRKKYCEQWSGNSLVDPANEPQYVKFLSWAPQPSLNGAQPSQLNIYEDFSVPTFIDHSTYYSADRSTSSNTNILDSRLNQKHGDKISTFENAFNRTTTNNTKNNL